MAYIHAVFFVSPTSPCLAAVHAAPAAPLWSPPTEAMFHDGPAALLDHLRDGAPHGEHRAVEVDAHDPTPDIIRQLADALHVVHHGGVVDTCAVTTSAPR